MPNDSSEADLRYAVSPGYFDGDADSAAPRAAAGRTRSCRAPRGRCCISESFAKRKFPGQGSDRAAGSRRSRRRPRGPAMGHGRGRGGRREADLARAECNRMPSTPRRRSGPGSTTRSRWWFAAQAGDAAALAPAIENAIWSVDKDQPIVRVATMDSAARRLGGGAAFCADPVRGIRHRVALVLAATESTACSRAASRNACARSGCAWQWARPAATFSR